MIAKIKEKVSQFFADRAEKRLAQAAIIADRAEAGLCVDCGVSPPDYNNGNCAGCDMAYRL